MSESCKICGLPLATWKRGDPIGTDEERSPTLCWAKFGNNECTGASWRERCFAAQRALNVAETTQQATQALLDAATQTVSMLVKERDATEPLSWCLENVPGSSASSLKTRINGSSIFDAVGHAFVVLLDQMPKCRATVIWDKDSCVIVAAGDLEWTIRRSFR